ncbi:hypothetical protein LTS18_002079 [Coniosporium uncinatum]|uniref:Uncharacterized protein n=1 Tax=Coniosporium uncinatum TaxID=93489 RepID=A0ACC3CS85_9PEZI|nr:hypothetical protein LTS18_002079 [Coniosporium uncinatum]
MAADMSTAIDEKHVASTIAMDASESDSPSSSFGGQKEDVTDMKRLGKKQQFTAITCRILYNTDLLAAQIRIMVDHGLHWLNGNSVFSTGVYAGGFAGLFWSFLITCILSAPIVASLAEMDSMAPTSGGQYH